MSHVVLSSREWTGHVRPAGALKWLMLGAFIAAVAVAALLSVVTSLDAQQFYDSLHKPVFGPPRWLFAPAWSLLYVLIAVAGWLAWLDYGADRSFRWWCIHLALNAIWTPMFFGLHLFWGSFVEICAMWVALLVTVVLFSRRSEAATWLLLPNVLWVAFAGALNFSLAVLN